MKMNAELLVCLAYYFFIYQKKKKEKHITSFSDIICFYFYFEKGEGRDYTNRALDPNSTYSCYMNQERFHLRPTI